MRRGHDVDDHAADAEPRLDGGGTTGRGGATRFLRLLLAVAVGWGVVWLVTLPVPVPVVGTLGRAAMLAAVTAAALAGGAAAWRAGRRRGPAAGGDLLVAGTAVLLAGAATVSLRGTAWGFMGLASDASFRTEAVTRYTDSWRLEDYAYAGLPTYYPPALGWLQGRAAAVLDVPGWAVMKPSQVLLAALVPLLAHVLWQRVTTPGRAAVVVAATVLLTVDLVKPDEWLVLMCAVPWWIDLVRGARAPGARRWPWWGHGVLAGVLLLVHTYYFLPLAVASLLGWASDAVRRRRPELGPVRAVGVAAIGLVVSSPYWWPAVAARLSGAPSDSLQLRYSYAGANIPPPPLPVDVPGALGMIGVAWLLRAAWRTRQGHRDPLAGAVGLLLAGGWATMLAGAAAEQLDVGFLAFKSDEVVVTAMTVSGVCGLVSAWGALSRRPGGPGRRTGAWAVVVAAGLVVAVSIHWAAWWVVGTPVTSAQTTRYPDGSRPAGGEGSSALAGPAFVRPGSPSVAEVSEAWRRLTGREPDASTVWVTTRVDVLATLPVHPFLTWKSIYSNPLGEFEARLGLVRRLADCADPACARSLLADSPWGRIDGLVLRRDGAGLVMPVLVDDFPRRSTTTYVVVPRRLLRGPGFATVDVDGVSVVAVDP